MSTRMRCFQCRHYAGGRYCLMGHPLPPYVRERFAEKCRDYLPREGDSGQGSDYGYDYGYGSDSSPSQNEGSGTDRDSSPIAGEDRRKPPSQTLEAIVP